MPGEKAARRRGMLLVLTATVLWSLAGVFARLLGHLDLWTVVGWRATLGAASISVVGIVEWRLGRLEASFGFGRLSPVVAALAMIAISAYAAAVMTTTIADVMIIYATLPFVAAAIGWLVNREAVSARTLAAGAAAFAGIAVMVGGGLGSRPAPRAGPVGADDRRLRRHDGAATALSGRLDDCGQRHRRARLGPPRLRLSPQPAARARRLRRAVPVRPDHDRPRLRRCSWKGRSASPRPRPALISLLDVVLGPLWVFLVFGENPGVLTAIGGTIVLAAALWRMAPDLKRRSLLAREDA